MAESKVLKIYIEKVQCANKDGSLALEGLENTEAFVRVELRGGVSQKVSTASAKLKDNALVFEADLSLNLAEEASELRLLLCKKKEEGQTQSNVLSAAGIYVKDILRAAPIVKYFDLYKSYGAGFGGAVKLSLKLEDSGVQVVEPEKFKPKVKGGILKASSELSPEKKSKRGGFPFKLFLLAAAGSFAFVRFKK